jgi:hypothetical protein
VETSGSLSTRPLRPLTAGGIYSAAWRLYQQNFLPLIAIVAIVQVAVAVLVALVNLLAHTSATNPSVTNTITAAVAGLFTAVFAIVASFLQSGALTLAIADDYIGQPITVERAYAATGPRLGALLGTSLLVGILLFLMAITVVGIPFAIYFGIRWAFIAQVVMLEGLGGTNAMARSSQLVAGSWWRTLGILVLMAIMVAIVGAIVSGIFTAILGAGILSGIIQLIVQILLAPFYSAVVTLLYFDYRVRKEQLNHETLSGDMAGRPAPFGGLAGASPM